MSNTSENQAIINLAKENNTSGVHTLRHNGRSMEVLVGPDGNIVATAAELHKQQRGKPDGTRGVIQTTTINGFIEAVGHFSEGRNPVIYADQQEMRCFLDHPTPDEPDWLREVILFRAEKTSEFRFLLKFLTMPGSSSAGLSKHAMTEVMEELLPLAAQPTPEEKSILTSLSWGDIGQAIRAVKKTRMVKTTASEEDDRGNDGASRSASVSRVSEGERLPDLVMVKMPIFEGGLDHRLIIRLRVTEDEKGNPIWKMGVFRLQQIMDAERKSWVTMVREQTSVKVLEGTCMLEPV